MRRCSVVYRRFRGLLPAAGRALPRRLRRRPAAGRALAGLVALGCCALGGGVFTALAATTVAARRTTLAPSHPVIPPAPPLSLLRHHPGLPRLSAAQRARAGASRSRYRGLSASAALALARRPAGAVGLAARSFYQPLTLAKGERVLRFINPRTALVQEPPPPRTRKDPGVHVGRVLVASSMLPMEVGRGRHARPVDLSLTRAKGGLVPRASRVPVTLGHSAVRFDTLGVQLALQGARLGC
jgi:hypothetical protein